MEPGKKADFYAGNNVIPFFKFQMGESFRSFAFVKDGKLIVEHDEDGPFPVVIPCSGVEFIVNGQVCTKPTPVSKQDQVSIVPKTEIKEGSWSVVISPDGLEAVLQVNPTIVIHREIKDLPAVHKLQLAVTEWEELQNPLKIEELVEEISRLGITYGIDWQACSRGVFSKSKEELVIARGTPATPGKNGVVELLFSSEPKVEIEVPEDEKIDFRNRYFYISIAEGDVLAVKRLPIQGNPGVSVQGKVIMPAPPRDIQLIAGEGVVLDKDGQRAVAARAGRPSAYRSIDMVKVSVLPELLHRGDVGLASGNIVFQGDVMITGNVEEGTTVRAGGNIRVGGLVSGAMVTASEEIVINGNILSSTVIAGEMTGVIKEILPLVDAVESGLRELTIALKQLYSYSSVKKKEVQNYNVGLILKLLLAGKFSNLQVKAFALRKEVDSFHGPAKERFNDLLTELDRVLTTPLKVQDIREVESLSRQFSNWKQDCVSSFSRDGNVTVANILNSIVEASGSIYVKGGGCYNSQIRAGKNVSIGGVFRGGEISSWGDIYIGELGSISGTLTKIIAGPESKVSVREAYENSIIVIGNRSYQFKGREKNVRLWLDKEGSLQFGTI